MEEQLIGFECAKLAKEKGFDEKCTKTYDPNTKAFLKFPYEYMIGDESRAPISAPTQSLLQKWLREEHNLNVDVWNIVSTWYWGIDSMESAGTLTESKITSTTYELALEAGLLQALTLIK